KFDGLFFDKPTRLNEKHEDYSCPDFFKLGDKYVLMFISHYRGVQYYIGDYKNGRFIPERHERMNYYGGQFFANESLEDENGRRILWGWILEGRKNEPAIEEEFLGTMSLPRELTLGEDGLINVKPVEELKALRYDEVSTDGCKIEGERLLENISGRQLEIELELSAENAQKAGIKVCCSPDGEEETLIYYDNINKEVVIDTSKSSKRDDLFSPVKLIATVTYDRDELIEEIKTFHDDVRRDLVNDIECYVQRLPVQDSKSVKLRVFVDASVIEVFFNDSKCITQRVYPKYEESNLVKLFADGGKAKLSYLKAWKMDTTNAW
ncbi:MAG: GH32 C-terminal domain-containing protein, partial [Clostridia bacterium]|nr:GH32 C-terminal domain-containing protein [Clostridia bacterium]